MESVELATAGVTREDCMVLVVLGVTYEWAYHFSKYGRKQLTNGNLFFNSNTKEFIYHSGTCISFA